MVCPSPLWRSACGVLSGLEWWPDSILSYLLYDYQSHNRNRCGVSTARSKARARGAWTESDFSGTGASGVADGAGAGGSRRAVAGKLENFAGKAARSVWRCAPSFPGASAPG
jgi:hypothetical protein